MELTEDNVINSDLKTFLEKSMFFFFTTVESCKLQNNLKFDNIFKSSLIFALKINETS